MGRFIQVFLSLSIIGAVVHIPLNAIAEEKCGPYDGVDLTQDQGLLERILAAHEAWLDDNGSPELSEDDPRRANLCNANLRRSNLSKAVLNWAYLRRADLQGADLSGANLTKANLSDTNLFAANMKNAILWAADLSGAELEGANLTGADLVLADLDGADLTGVNLREAELYLTVLAGAKMTGARVNGAKYEPSSSPDSGFLPGIEGLREVWFGEGNHGGLVLLRTAIKKAGLRDLEREATYAIEKGKTKYTKGFEKWFRLIFFEWTSDYGLHYGRPILILVLLIVPFAVVYYFPISGRGQSRLYKVWSEERLEEDDPHDKPKRFIEPLIIDPKNSRLLITGYALYFSLLSAFHIGWRDLNVGNWIARIQPREYTLRAKGWVRTVSGIQSLISIYLLALWVLVYFGRPFE